MRTTTILAVAGLTLSALHLAAARTPAAPLTIQEKKAEKPAAAKTFEVDPVHSSVLFAIEHMGASRFYGRFNQVQGSFTIDEATPANTKVSIEIPLASIDTNNKDRDDHLKGPDFFDVKQFPSAKFDSKSAKKSGAKTWAITGTLSLHGVTREIALSMEHVGTGPGFQGGTLSGFEGRFTLKRKDYGIDYGEDALGSDVEVIVSIEGLAK